MAAKKKIEPRVDINISAFTVQLPVSDFGSVLTDALEFGEGDLYNAIADRVEAVAIKAVNDMSDEHILMHIAPELHAAVANVALEAARDYLRRK